MPVPCYERVNSWQMINKDLPNDHEIFLINCKTENLHLLLNVGENGCTHLQICPSRFLRTSLLTGYNNGAIAASRLVATVGHYLGFFASHFGVAMKITTFCVLLERKVEVVAARSFWRSYNGCLDPVGKGETKVVKRGEVVACGWELLSYAEEKKEELWFLDFWDCWSRGYSNRE